VSERDRHLRAVAERVAAAYVAHTNPRAILLTGSAAEGGGDHHSDVDMLVYYDGRPTEEQLESVRRAVGAARVGGRGKYWVDGVEIDGGATTVAECEQWLADVLERLEVRSQSQKACEGILRGLPVHGAELIEGWQARLRAYPPELARKMVEAHLTFWPVWQVGEWLLARDMGLWYQQTLVDSSHNVLGVLAGVNHLYFHPAYFKRLRRFVGGMRVAPVDLAERLEGLFAAEPRVAIAELERLVGETAAIVEAEMPDVDTTAVRKELGVRRPG
jgi:hypothetical protein